MLIFFFICRFYKTYLVALFFNSSSPTAIYTTNWNNNGVRVYDYHVNPAVWGTSGSSIGRIGTIAHEIGHFLELPDLYGDRDSEGIGSFGLMANSWGIDGSQFYPPLMSTWAKEKLGWVTPTVVSTSGTYSLGQACDNDETILINAGFPNGEYLLIENRQPCGFDSAISQGGLAIFHIDENANNIRGFPQAGWPGNGNHYKVALLQADGNYNMERGNNRGDSGDLFHAGGVNSIGPHGTSAGNPYPNTNAYQGGVIIDSLVTISDISVAGSRMTFDIEFGTNEPTECNGYEVQVSVTSDNYPSETSWTIQDASGVIASDGGKIIKKHTDYITDICLDRSGCYTFTINDSFGDGIVDPGTFSLTVDGEVKLSKPNNGFSSFNVDFGACGNEFCGNNICDVNAGEGCGSCAHDCFLPTHCNAISDTISKLKHNRNVYGMVFDVTVASRSVYFYELAVYTVRATSAKIYMSNGSYSDESNLENWTKVFDGSVKSSSDAMIKLDSRFYGAAGSTVAIYIAYESPGVFIHSTGGEASNEDITMKTGKLAFGPTQYDALPRLLSSSSGAANFVKGIKYDYAARQLSTLAPTPLPTVAPVVSPTSSSCSDRTGRWKINGKERSWCNWVLSFEESERGSRCTSKKLHKDCAITCGSCSPPTPAPAPIPSATTPSPVVSPTSSSCSDRTGRWKINGKERSWCTWVLSFEESERGSRCIGKNLLKDCAVTCGSCSPSTPAPAPIPSATTPSPVVASSSCSNRIGRWDIGGTFRFWCRWAESFGEEKVAWKCAFKDLYEDCPVTCGVCDP